MGGSKSWVVGQEGRLEGVEHVEGLIENEVEDCNVVAADEFLSVEEVLQLDEVVLWGVSDEILSLCGEILFVSEEDSHGALSQVIEDSLGLSEEDLLFGGGSEKVGSTSLVSKIDWDGTWLEDDGVSILKVGQVGKRVSGGEGGLFSSPLSRVGVFLVLIRNLKILQQESHFIQQYLYMVGRDLWFPSIQVWLTLYIK